MIAPVATYTLEILDWEGETQRKDVENRMLANLPAMLEAVEEDLSNLLPEGYSAKIKENPHE
jgi:hypothetical protein